MNDLLVAIRSALIADSTLLSLLPAADITTTYNKEAANYPCLVFGISGVSGVEGSADLKIAQVTFTAYSRTTKLATMQIISRVRDMFNNLPSAVSDASTYVHVSREQAGRDGYDSADETWIVSATYEMMYSASTFVAFTLVSGVVYADASSVSVDSSKKIADVTGNVSLETIFESVYRSEQNRFRNGVIYKSGITRITIQKMVFKPSSVNLIWSITRSASDTLADVTTAATSYTIGQASQPNSLQFLLHGTRSDNGKVIEIRANKAYCESMNIPFGTAGISMYDVAWTCLADGSNNVVKVSEEN